MPTSECEHIIDTAIGIVLTNLHSIPPRLFPLEIQGRRRAEGVIHEIRKIIADQCLRRAQEHEAALVTSEPSGDADGCDSPTRRSAGPMRLAERTISIAQPLPGNFEPAPHSLRGKHQVDHAAELVGDEVFDDTGTVTW